MKHISMWLLLLFTSISFSQIKITGTITDKNSGVKIPYVSISSSTKNGTTSDLNGNYSIVVSNKNQFLTFTYLGYTTQIVKVENQTKIDIQLTEQETSLNEVVVTALGVNRQTKELGYVVQELKAEALTTIKTPNFLDNLS